MSTTSDSRGNTMPFLLALVTSALSTVLNLLQSTMVRWMAFLTGCARLVHFASVANVTFPSIYRNFLYVIEVVKLDLTSFLSFGCLIETNFFDRLLVVTMSPLVVLALLGVTFWVARRRYGRQGPEMEEIGRKHVSAFVLVTFLVYSPVSTVVFETFACDPLDDGYSYLRADYRILCRDTSGELNAWYMGFLVYAALMALLYPLGIPALYAVILFMGWKRRPRRQPIVVDEPSRFSRSYSQARDSFSGEEREGQSKFDHIRAGRVDDIVRDLSEPYKKDCFYYEVVECVRRVMLTGVVVFVFPDSVAQVSTTFLLALVFFAVFEVQNPYESIQNSWTSRLGHLIVLLSMFTALLLKVDLTDESDTGEELFSVILVVANVVMIVAVVAQSILSFYVEVLED